MATNHLIKFSMIAELFKNDENQLKRGENSFESGHVKKIIFDGNIEPAVIKGEVHASMKNKFYVVDISVDLKKRSIVGKRCTCPRGVDLCHHMGALLYYAHYNISATDKEKVWGTPGKSTAEDEIQTIEELFPPTGKYVAINDKNKLKLNEFREMLGDSNVVGYSWLLKPEADEAHIALIPSIEDILFSEEYINAEDKKMFLMEKCRVLPTDISNIARSTIGQHRNEYWLIARKNRITASKFGNILNACFRKKFPPSLFKSLVEGYSLDGVHAVQWGRNHESTALQKFIEQTGFQVEATGIWLDECGFMGASPDGLIGEDSILEIKCPYRMRNGNIKESVTAKKYFFHYDSDVAVLDPSHIYYHQVQGQLYITGREKCYFFVWTPQDTEILLINKDLEWGANLTILRDFYTVLFVHQYLSK